MSNATYYEHVQIPVFCVFIVFVWAFVSVRIHIFEQSKAEVGWQSFRGTSTALTISCGVLLTIYVALMIAIYFINERALGVREWKASGQNHKIGTTGWRHPENFTDAEITFEKHQLVVLIRLIYTARLLLTIALWLTKCAFLAIFLETKSSLSRASQYFLHFTSLATLTTFLAAIWCVGKDMNRGLIYLTPTDAEIRQGFGYNGARFLFHDFDVELLLVTMNIFTDLCLLLIAYKTLVSFPSIALASIFLPILMISITVLIAIAKLVLAVLGNTRGENTTFLGVPFQLCAECEAFMAVIVTSFPNLRAFLRRLEARGVGGLISRRMGVSGRSGSGSSGGKKSDLESAGARVRSDGAVFLTGEEYLRGD